MHYQLEEIYYITILAPILQVNIEINLDIIQLGNFLAHLALRLQFEVWIHAAQMHVLAESMYRKNPINARPLQVFSPSSN